MTREIKCGICGLRKWLTLAVRREEVQLEDTFGGCWCGWNHQESRFYVVARQWIKPRPVWWVNIHQLTLIVPIGNTLVLSPFHICRHRCAHLHRDGHVDLQLVHCAGILPQRDGSVRLRGPAVSRLVPRERCYKGSVVAACVLHAAVLCCWRLLLVLPTAVLHLLRGRLLLLVSGLLVSGLLVSGLLA